MKTSLLPTFVFCIILIISTANRQVQPDGRRRKSPPTPPPPSPPPPSPPPPSPPPPSPNELEYFIVVQQWPGACCYYNQDDCVKNKLVNDFCIHGIWPENSSGVSLQGCADPKPFQASFVKRIERDLKTYWPSFSHKLSDQKFWVKRRATDRDGSEISKDNPTFMTQERVNEASKNRAEPQFMSQQGVNIIKPPLFMAGPSQPSISTRDASAILNGSKKFASLSSL
ncbi:hypothetical protein LguiB_014055 [Lonicera macranthoides]